VSSRHLVGRRPKRERPRNGVPPASPGAGAGTAHGSGIRRRRTALLLAALGLAPLAAVALLTTTIAGSAITDQVNARIAGASRQAAGYLEQVVAGRVSALDTVANDLPILAIAEGSTTADPTAAMAALKDLSQAESAAQGIVLTNAAGSKILQVGSRNPLTGLPAGWRTTLAHGGHLAAGAQPPLPPAMDVAVPVLEGGGNPGGFLVETYSLGGAVTNLESFAGPQGMSLLVLDRAGNLVLGVQASGTTASETTAWRPEPPVTSSVDASLLSNAQVVDDGGASGPAAYVPVSETPWVVRAVLPSSVLASVSSLRIAVFSICAALGLLFLAAVNLVNQALRRQEQTETQLILQTAAMEHVAMHDPLTGLPNRLLFNDRLQHGISNARRSGRPLALFVLDVDGFKALNDDLGHSAGDTVLRETAARLQACVRASDTVARLGGDEFVIVAVDADASVAELITSKVRQRMEEPVEIEGRPVPVGLSVGLAFYPEDGSEPPQLLRRADTNMYREKRARKAASV